MTNALEHVAKRKADLELAEQYLAVAITAATTKGATWQQIGDLLGMSRQAAWERFKTD